MLHILHLLISTVILRPYVFVLFVLYVSVAIITIGIGRTALFTTLSFTVAFLCEWSSAVVATGFPFGLYTYVRLTEGQELWIAGVPFMDSLSFTFLSYISWRLSSIIFSGVKEPCCAASHGEGARIRDTWRVTLFAAFLMVCLDIIIDPVALRGDRWFLGKIYYYPNGGAYFGVTVSNFLGWFFVCLVILRLFIYAEWLCFRRGGEKRVRLPAFSRTYGILGSVVLYFIVMGFNIFITFMIGEITLGVIGTCISALLLSVTIVSILRIFLGTEAYRQRELSLEEVD